MSCENASPRSVDSGGKTMSYQVKLELGQSRTIYLKCWTEIVGIFRGISSDDSYTYIKINDKVLFFPRESRESKLVQHKLSSKSIGQKLGILYCDEPTRPILIRTFNEGVAQPVKSASKLITTT